MGTNFPTALDTSTDLPAIASTDQENTAGNELHVVTTNVNAAVLAVETKLGIDSSTDTNSFDYKLSDARTRLTTAESAIATKADLVAGKVPSGQLPSYVDDVLEYADFAALPGTGETGKIYVTLDTNFEYRWSGSAYIQIVASPGTTDALAEGTTNLYFTAARVLATVLAGFSTASSAVVTAADTVLVAIGKLQAQISALIASLAPVATSGSASDLSTGTLNAGRLPASGVSAGTYGDGTHALSATVDSAGRVTAISTVSISGGGNGPASMFNFSC